MFLLLNLLLNLLNCVINEEYTNNNKNYYYRKNLNISEDRNIVTKNFFCCCSV